MRESCTYGSVRGACDETHVPTAPLPRHAPPLLPHAPRRSAAAWPLSARAQQPKRVGVLMGSAASAANAQSKLMTFIHGLRKLGWIDGQNLQIEVRWSAADRSLIQAYASDLVGLIKPRVLLDSPTAQ